MNDGILFIGIFLLACLAGTGIGLILEQAITAHKHRIRIQRMALNRTGGQLNRPPQTPEILGKRWWFGRTRPDLQRLEYLLVTSGIPMTAKAFILIPLSAGLVSALLLGMLLHTLILPFAVLILFTSVPMGVIYFKTHQIQRALIAEIPEAAGMIVRGLQVGRHVDQALKDAANALSGPLGTEIRIVYQEIAMGLSFDQALRNFENRYHTLPDVKLFCTAFIIQRETGGNLVQILEALADTIRKRFSFRRKLKTYSAEARASAIIISLLPFVFALVAWFVNTEYILRLTGTPLGRMMILAAIGFEITGFLVMRKMTQVKL